jgi:hypothetical protein
MPEAYFRVVHAFHFIAMEIYPFVGSLQYPFVYRVLTIIFDDVYILSAEALARANYSAGILGLVNVFKHDGDVPRPPRKYFFDKFLFMVSNVLAEVLDELFFPGGHDIAKDTIWPVMWKASCRSAFRCYLVHYLLNIQECTQSII